MSSISKTTQKSIILNLKNELYFFWNFEKIKIFDKHTSWKYILSYIFYDFLFFAICCGFVAHLLRVQLTFFFLFPTTMAPPIPRENKPKILFQITRK